MRFFAKVGHCIECEGHVEPLLVGLASGCLNADGCHYSSHNNLGNASHFELGLKIRGCECAPTTLGDGNITRLPIQLRQKVGQTRRVCLSSASTARSIMPLIPSTSGIRVSL